MKSTNPGRLERWLGADVVETLSQRNRGWYGPPIPVGGVPGNVWATGDGDFIGEIRAGYEATAMDRARDMLRRYARGYRRACRRHGTLTMGGFSTIADMQNEARAGKRQLLTFTKTTGAGGPAVGRCHSLFRLGAVPPAGSAASAAPGGDAPTSATTGALPFANAISGDFNFIAGTDVNGIVANGLLLYDRIFQVAKTMNSTATEAVTGVPTRYQSTTPLDPDYAAGNFLFPDVTASIANTAHNHTVVTYTDQDGNAGATLPSISGVAASASSTLDLLTGNWFMPLASGDTGVKALTQMQSDALVATGTMDFVIGHPLGWLPCPVAGLLCMNDGIKSSFNLARVFDNACMTFLCFYASTTSSAWNGQIEVIGG